ncbi:MAG: hypothetical protein J6Z03_09580 [Erysipelotrichaceae bacterium]|nr:hypothetical protein [Erysipelotrichaceae bacterium]
MKKILNVLLILLLGICMFGCSNSSESSSNNVEPTNNDKPADEPLPETVWLRSRETTSFNGGDISEYTVYEYDTEGNVIKTVRYKGQTDEVDHTVEITYDDSGRTLKTMDYDGDGQLTFITEYEYLMGDQPSKITSHYADGTVGDYTSFEYNSAGQVTRMKNYTADNFLSQTTETEYDEKGRTAKMSIHFEGYGDWSYVYEYDGELNNRVVMYDTDGSVSNIIENTYKNNDPELLESAKYYDKDNNLYASAEYRYDDDGNMVSFAQFDPNGNMTMLTEYEYIKK